VLHANVEIGPSLGHAERLTAATRRHAIHPLPAVHYADASGGADDRETQDFNCVAEENAFNGYVIVGLTVLNYT
jgi:hypothetical protein